MFNLVFQMCCTVKQSKYQYKTLHRENKITFSKTTFFGDLNHLETWYIVWSKSHWRSSNANRQQNKSESGVNDNKCIGTCCSLVLIVNILDQG